MPALILSAILYLAALDTGLCALSAAGCGTTKTCYRNPEGCSLSHPECRFVSWKKSDSGDTYEFEMSGNTGDGGSYVAFAISTTNTMQDADMYYCDGNNLHSGVIRSRAEPTYLSLSDGLIAKRAATENGVALCVLTRPRSVTKAITSGNHNFDIMTRTYHLLVAQGDTKEGGILKHNWKAVGPEYNFSALAMSTPDTTQSAATATDGETNEMQTQAVSGDTTPTPQEYKVTREGCGSTKTCFSDPENCELSSANCRFYSWKKLDSGKSEIEMSGGAGNGDVYIAFAFGTTNQMKDADMYYCDGVGIHSAVITARHEEPTYLDDSVGIDDQSAWTVNGVAQCKLVRPQSVTKNISTEAHDFDLAARQYFLLGAQGPTKEGGIQVHGWKILGGPYQFSSAGYRLVSLQPAMITIFSLAATILCGKVTLQ